MKHIKLFEQFINEAKYNTVQKVVSKLGRTISTKDLAKFVKDNFYDVTGTRDMDDMDADEKIADLIGFYKLDPMEWEEAWAEVTESVNEAEIPKSELKMLDTVKKLAKKYGFKTIKNPDKWLKKIGHDEDGIVTVALFLHPDTKNDFGYVEVYHQKDKPEYLEVSFYAWGSSGNDSIDDWTTDEYWEDYFGEDDFEEEDFDESVNEAEKPLYKKGQKVQYKMEYSGGVGAYADSKSESPNVKTGVIISRKKTLSSYKYVLSDGMTVYQSEIIGLA